MSNKSIIEIEVSDSQFQDFFRLFESYKEKLEQMPEDWKKVNDATSESSNALEVTAAAILGSLAEASGHASILTKNLREAADAQKEFGSSTNMGANNLKSMAKDAKQLGESIFGIGKYLFKIGAIGVGSATASLFGIDALANAAVNNQRTARGLGLTTGQNRAFDNDLSRDIDRSTLSSVADAQNSYVGRMWLARATGLSQTDVQNTDAGSLSAQLAIKAHDWWASTPESQHTDANLFATGFPQSGMSLSDVRRQGNTPRQELVGNLENYRRDAPGLNQSDSSINALYDFSRSLKNAGDHLEIDLANRLSELNKSGALSHFIESLEKDAELLINGVLSESNLNSIEGGMKEFADYLGSPEFKADVKGFADDLGKLAKIVHDVANFGSSWTNPAQGSTEDKVDKAADTLWGYFAKAGGNALDFGKAAVGTIAHPIDAAKKLYNSQFNALTDKKNLAFLASLESQYQLPSGMLGATSQVESSGSVTAVSPVGARGAFQLMPDTAKALGVTNSFDFSQSAQAAAKLYAQLFARYNGDTRKALAAYNWNPRALDADIAKHGEDWERYAPKETQNQIARVLANMSKYGTAKVNVLVTNKSGTNVAVSTNAGSI